MKVSSSTVERPYIISRETFARLNLSEMIEMGQYEGFKDENINEENFPKPKNLLLNFYERAFHFNQCLYSEDVLCKMKAHSHSPFNIWDLLYLGMRYPNLQVGHVITALGSRKMIGGVWQTPCLSSSGFDKRRWFGLVVESREQGSLVQWNTYAVHPAYQRV